MNRLYFKTLRRGLTVLALVAVCALGVAPGIYAQESGRRHFDIPAGDLGKSLTLLAQQAEREVVFSAEIARGKRSVLVKGDLTTSEALDKILANSGLSHRVTTAGPIVIEASSGPLAGGGQAIASPAVDSSDGATQSQVLTEVIVTGTQIRGVAPAGTNVVNVDRDEITATGAQTAMQVLSSIPQVTTAFNQAQQFPTTFGVARTIVRPSIRNVGGGTGGSSTLILIDGHRAVPAGTLEATPDVDVIPAGILERVEVVPDGGSSVYGSDAVGGVINFITRKRFDGFDFNSHYGVAAGYRALDFNLTGGRDWGSGSAYLSYFFANNDPLFGRDRGYVRQMGSSTGGCAPGTVVVTRTGVATNYALPGRVPGTLASCDYTDSQAVFPANTRNSVFVGLTQAINDTVEFNLTAFYTRRRTVNHSDLNQPGNLFATASQSGTITAANPYYVPIAPDPGQQTVQFSYAGVFDNRGTSELEEYGATPSITAKLGENWQLRLLGNVGRSTVNASTPAIDTAAQAAALAGSTTATALNPYSVGSTNSAVLASINRSLVSPATHKMVNGRAIVDGTLWTLPGGELRTAIGAEYYRETYSLEQNTYAPGVTIPQQASSAGSSRHVESLFGELSVPVIGGDNATPFARSLVVSLSARYDKYSDFGDTTNPKVGITYKPVDWVSVRGNFGKSFNAPGLGDSGGIEVAQLFSISPFRAATDPLFPNLFRPTIILAGSNPALRPQTADTWSYGVDIEPPVTPGLSLSLTHYSIDMKEIIGVPPFFAPVLYTPPYAAFVTKDPTLAQALAATAGLQTTGNFPSVAAIYATAGVPYVLMDARQHNLGQLKQQGVDFNADYARDTAFGSFNAGIGGTYILKRDSAPVAGQPFVSQLTSPGSSRLSSRATVGVRVGNLTASANYSYIAGYDISPAVGGQTHVGSFGVMDLFAAYAVKSGALQDLRVTLNISNALDRDPPFFNQDPGYTNGSTLGRFVQLGLGRTF